MSPSNHANRTRRFLLVSTAAATTALLVMFGSEYTITVVSREQIRRIPVVHPSYMSETRRQGTPPRKSKRQHQQSRVESISEAALLERQKFNDALQENYGVEEYKKMFFLGPSSDPESSVGRYFFGPFNSTVESFNRSKFVLVGKLVRSILGDETHEGGFPLVWTTGGNSVAAGHGNLFEESYTQVLTRAVTPSLTNAAGFDFTSRLYASSAVQSAPETAFCHEAIYGTDVSILVWDFSLTDGRRVDSNYNKMEWYFTRAATTHTAQPKILLALNVYDDPGRLAVLQRLAEKGLTVLFSRQAVMDHVVEQIPDTMGRTGDEIATMPRYIQKLKCGSGTNNKKNAKLELNEPLCLQSDKFNPLCPKRLYQVNWHPGWKWNALIGNLLALFVLDLLAEAIHEVSAALASGRELNEWLRQLKDDEHSQREFFRQSEYHESLKAIIPESTEHEMIDWDLLVKGSVYCHLSILPSETRRKGIVINDTDHYLDLYSMETGAISRDLIMAETVSIVDVHSTSASSQDDTMRLVYEAADKAPKKFQCDQQLHIDFKEYFYVSKTDGWKHVIVPNQAEEKEYGTGMATRTGVVAFCLKWCNWNDCPEGNIDIAGIRAGNATVEINGEPVVKLTSFESNGQECVLTGTDKSRNWTPNQDGRFVIRARVAVPGSFVRFTSFIVWYDSSSLL